MSVADIRADLAEALEEALTDSKVTVHDGVPEEVATPAVVVQPADGYLSPDPQSMRSDAWLLRADVYVLVDLVNNEAADDELADVLEDVLPVLLETDWTIGPSTRPSAQHTSGWLAYGCSFPLTIPITLT